MPKRIFIIGGAGFIGSQLARKLVSRGDNVGIFMRTGGNAWRIKDISRSLVVYSGDILDVESLQKALSNFNPNIIVNFAVSQVFGGQSSSERELFEHNFIGFTNIMNATEKIPYECFINTGTSSEYGIKQKPLKESDVCEPVIAHGIFKLVASLYGQMVARTQGRPIITLRPFSPYGPYDDERRFTSKAILEALRNEDAHLASPTVARDYIFVEDVVDFYIECIDRGAMYAGEIFNVGTGKQATLKDLISIVDDVVKPSRKLHWGVFKGASYDTDYWEADMTKTFSCFTWRPTTSLRDGIKKTVDWYKAHPDLQQCYVV